MRRVVVVCEGQTEERFVATLLMPAFLPLGLHLQGIILETSPGHKGGALSAERFLRGVRNALAQRSAVAVTTLIDLYRLGSDFPGCAGASAHWTLERRLQHLEASLHAEVLNRSGCEPRRFIAHIQPYEFEALLFSHLPVLGELEPAWTVQTAPLVQALQTVDTPEQLNDGPTTKPAARLERALRQPPFRKLRHGPLLAERIGLARIEAACPHFAAWMGKLRGL